MLERSIVLQVQTRSLAFVAPSFMIKTRVLNLSWMETNRNPPPPPPSKFPLPGIRDFGEVRNLTNCTTGGEMKSVQEGLLFTRNALKGKKKKTTTSFYFFFTKRRHSFGRRSVPVPSSPTSRSKKPVSLARLAFFFFFFPPVGDSPQRRLRCLFFVVVVRRIEPKKKKEKERKSVLAGLWRRVCVLVGTLASSPWRAEATHCAVTKSLVVGGSTFKKNKKQKKPV